MIPYSYFIHSEDEKALNAMKAIPGFDRLVKKFMEVGYESLVNGENLASQVLLSDEQLPDIYHRVTRICDKLGIKDYPQVYLCMSPYPNAWTYGDTNVSITLTSALFDYLEDDEIDSVIAHECGHILCHHVLYNTVARFVYHGVTGLMSDLATPLRLAISWWDRKSELSADRVAALVCGADTVVRTQLRLSGGPKSLTKDIDIEKFAQQAEMYEELLTAGKVDGLLQKVAVMDESHPFSAVRVHEILDWTKSREYETVRNLYEGNSLICPHRRKPVMQDWIYCRYCGEKIREEQ